MSTGMRWVHGATLTGCGFRSAHLSNIWSGASLQWLAADYHARKLSPSEDPLNDLTWYNCRVRGHQADEVLRLIAERYETSVPQDRSRDISPFETLNSGLGQREDQPIRVALWLTVT